MRKLHSVFNRMYWIRNKYIMWSKKEHPIFTKVLNIFLFILIAGLPSVALLVCGYIEISVIWFLISVLISISMISKNHIMLTLQNFGNSAYCYLKFGWESCFFAVLFFISLILPSAKNVQLKFDNFLTSLLGKTFEGYGTFIYIIGGIGLICLVVWFIISLFVDPRVCSIVNTITSLIIGVINRIVNYIFSFFPPGMHLINNEQNAAFIQITGGLSLKDYILIIVNTIFLLAFIVSSFTAAVGAMRGYYFEKHCKVIEETENFT